MLPDERRRELVDIINERHGCSVEKLATSLEVSEATIRRDLRELEAESLVRRTHGGAMPVVDQRRPYERRIVRNQEEKEAIAERALTEIHRDQIVYFDSGTTTFQIAKRIPEEHDIVAVTNGAINAYELSNRGVRVHLTGGMFWTDSNAVVGPWTEERIEEMNFDLLFLGTEGVDPEGLTTQNVQQSGIKERMIASSRRVVVVADSTKLGEEHFVRFADPGDVDLLLTDGEIPEAIREPFEAAGADLVGNLL
jgi:DeoR family fructose operon transcriptional repressor